MRTSKKVALSAVISALGVIILFAGGLLGVLDISSACLVSFFVLFISVEVGQVYALLCYAVISVLGFLLCGENLFAPVCFTFFFGPMAITKFLFEKAGKLIGWILKIALPAALLAVGWMFFSELLEMPEKTWMKIAYYAAFLLIAVLTQILYTSIIRQYFFRFRDKISKYLK